MPSTSSTRHQQAVGKKYGRLKVHRIEYEGHMPFAECLCECGELARVRVYKLYDGHTQSCGCMRREVLVARSTTHGRCHTPAYRSWQAMIHRCCNPRASDYASYGGRGIKVCERWRESFAAFVDDMGERAEGMEVDRVDNDGDYEPGNCRWATRKQQNRNSRHNHNLTLSGKTQPVSAWCEELGLAANTIDRRLARGWSVEKTLTTPGAWWRRRGQRS